MSLELFHSQVIPIRPKLFRFAYRLLNNEEDAKDIIQDALLKVWHQQERMTELQNPEAWCMRIVRNLALDRLKSKKYRLTEGLEKVDGIQSGHQPSPHLAAEQHDVMSRVHRIINALPEKYRTAIQLRDMDGFSYQEIADVLEITLSEVKINLHRARKAVREQLQNLHVYGLQ
ncbi:RNA polymerase sigma factor [Chitinophaga japonensis]|uniref:RNA polymerase sigma-70 factor (ECF subfamily) n=1 Tax=Chitinophaga japonensis TaxID=104662 RepID=A0A562SN07_CHIJA|nr:RNA polymerase sigma factor [Chitinophaga japonensis]TWI82384.1 RNA polymerase sigma-70 factor (ECF subfamily) [Chitinophaga japonensis]